MNYEKLYSQFIVSRKIKEADWLKGEEKYLTFNYDKRRNVRAYLKEVYGYTECHHILPKSLGGNDEGDNLIYLTAEDHIHAHILLGKIHGGKSWYAVQYIMGNHKKYKRLPTKKMIKNAAFARVQQGKAMGGKNHHMFGKHHTEETRKKMVLAWTEERKENLRTKIKSPEWREANKHVRKASSERWKKNHPMKNKASLEKMRLSMTGKKHTEETKLKMSIDRTGEKHAMFGKKHTDASRLQMSKSATGRKMSEETRLKCSGANNSVSIACICTTTGKVFDSILDAAKFYNLNSRSVNHCVQREIGMKNGLNFEKI